MPGVDFCLVWLTISRSSTLTLRTQDWERCSDFGYFDELLELLLRYDFGWICTLFNHGQHSHKCLLCL